MPRSNLKKARGEYVGSDFNRYVASLDLPNRVIGETLGMTSQAVSHKRRKGQWTLAEACKIFKLGEATDSEILRIVRLK